MRMRLRRLSAAPRQSLFLRLRSTSAAVSPVHRPRGNHLRLCETPTADSCQQSTNHYAALKRGLSLVKSCDCYTHVLQLHAHLLRTHLFCNHDLSLSFFSRAAQFTSSLGAGYLCRFFSKFSRPRLAHYNVIIRAFYFGNSPKSGVRLLGEMQRKGVAPNRATYLFGVKCCAKKGLLFEGMQVHAGVLVNGSQSDCGLMTGLMEMYSVCEECDDAIKIFDEIPERDVVAWNVLISCFMRNSRTRDALCLFDAMQNLEPKCEPDDVTCLLLLQACASLAALDFGKKVHDFINQHQYDGATNVCNVLISMYMKCGCIDEAYKVFNTMSNKNVVSWAAIIYGLAKNGRGQDAIAAFWEMQRIGIAPDSHTFNGVILACSHSGLVNEGKELFIQMKKEFGIVPNIHHYGCMVDLLGRVGLLDQAYDLILSMSVKPDAKIWRTLLRACKAHKNVRIGEYVIDRLVEVKAQEARDYVMLLNLYSLVGNQEKANQLKEYMKENGIGNEGCCTMELRGVLQEFIGDDTSHPQKEEIYKMLEEIGQQLKIAGYVPDLTPELENLGAEKHKKIGSTSLHSEKLAIAYAVLMTPPTTTIRISKNGRVCADCHNFAKAISSAYNRKVIITDSTGFHHFRGGCCSCNDYWQ